MDVLSMDKQLEKIKQQKDHFLEFMPIVLFEFVWGGGLYFRKNGAVSTDDIAIVAYLQITQGNERIMKTCCIRYEKKHNI